LDNWNADCTVLPLSQMELDKQQKKPFSRRRIWKPMGEGSATQKAAGDAANAAKASETVWARIVESFKYPMQIIGRDPKRLEAYLAMLAARGDWMKVMVAFENAKPWAQTDAALRYYMEAVVEADKRKMISLPEYVRSYGGSFGGNRGPLAGGAGPRQPLHVALATNWAYLLIYIIMGLAFLIIFFLTFRSSGMNNFSKKYQPIETTTVTFDDVKGNDEAKEELRDLVSYLREPWKFKELGVKVPKGVLLVGPPGTGKTLLARALAGEAGVPFISTSGSEFEEMLVGVGARRIRELFQTARERSPCIIFIDEIDALGSRREDITNRNKMSLNQLLVELDGFSPSSGVVIIGATNMAEILDPALVRPGRFDRKVVVELPDVKGRRDILDHYLESKRGDDVNTETLASATPGFSGADIENMVNWAAIEATKRHEKKIRMRLLEDALLNVAMGRERKSLLLSDHVKRLCAYHEAGHAIVALHTAGASAIRKATLIPRGHALGMVNFLPKDDSLVTKKELQAQMDVAMGGRVAEELFYGPNEVTQGAGSDFKQATSIAKQMVTKLGMSEKVGPIHLGERDLKQLSPDMHNLVENEIRRLLDESYSRSRQVLTDKKEQVNRLAAALLKYETLSLEEINLVIQGHDLKHKLEEMTREKAIEEQRRRDEADLKKRLKDERTQQLAELKRMLEGYEKKEPATSRMDKKDQEQDN
jgi:ATP-dependent metalloprotease FtsH